MVSLPPPNFPVDLPAPGPNPSEDHPQDWTVTLTQHGKQVVRSVKDAVAAWEGSMLIFRDAAGTVVAQFPEDEVDSYH